MNNFWNWLVKSSADQTQVAATAKGLITSILPLLMIIFHSPSLNGLPDTVYTLVVAALTIVSSLHVIFGIFRKVYFSFTA